MLVHTVIYHLEGSHSTNLGMIKFLPCSSLEFVFGFYVLSQSEENLLNVYTEVVIKARK